MRETFNVYKKSCSTHNEDFAKQKEHKISKTGSFFGTLMFSGILILFSFTSPYFLTFSNLSNILLQSSIVGVASLGMVYVIIVGGDDVIQGELT